MTSGTMHAVGLGQALPLPKPRACAALKNAERITSGSQLWHSSCPGRAWGSPRLSVTSSAKREDYTETERGVKTMLPSILRFLPREAEESEESKGATSSDGEAVEQGETTVEEGLQAIKNTILQSPVKTVGQIALFGGLAAAGFLISGTLLASVNRIPLAAEILQAVGVVYSLYIASQVSQKKAVEFPPPSPFRAIIDLVEGGQPRMVAWRQNLQEEVSEGVADALEKLQRERDKAVNEAEELRENARNLASVVTEKEALEAVALQLADERDVAMTEVSTLQEAVRAITARIKAIEDLLEKEVTQLREHSQALETVSLQLAAERDDAIQEVAHMQNGNGVNEQIGALELVASELAQERDEARTEVEDLRKVVTILREASGTSSGLTTEQEAFVKARIRDMKAQFIDLERVYEDQKDEVDRFIDHLVQEYSVPRDWTANYIKQYLNSSAMKNGPSLLESDTSQLDNLAAQNSVN